MPESQSLAIVTGAAHRVGKVFAHTLARNGFAVLIHYHNSKEKAEGTAAALRAEGVPAFLFQADLVHSDQIDALFAYTDTLPHPLKVLVNSAALMQRHDIRTMSAAEWDATMALNLRAPFLCAQRAAQRMKDGGLIVNISDIAARKAWTAFPAYTVSKAGLEALTQSAARVLAPAIRVNAIAPGLAMPNQGLPQEEWERLVNRIPLKRASVESELASALEFLLKNEYITGTTLTVDGGYALL